MASATIPFDALLSPISKDRPTGLPLRDDAAGFLRDFYDLRDAANEARTTERKLANYIPPLPGEEDPYKPKPPDWDVVLAKSIDILSHKSKDLWVVAWMIEALCRLQGFVGLRDGFTLARELCDRYWDQLHPRSSDGGLDELLAQFAGLNGVEGEGTLIPPLKAIAITTAGGPGPYSYADFLGASRLEQERDAERRQKRIADGEVSLEQFEAAVAKSSREYYVDLLAAVDAVIAAFDGLNQLLQQRCGSAGSDPPPSSNIGNVLAEIRHRVALLAGEHEAGDASAREQETGAGDTSAVAGVPAVSPGQIASRNDAFRVILSIADYFEKTEPHSPVSYGLRQVVHWGRLSLPELLTQLIDSPEARDKLFRHIGIGKPAEPDS